MTPPSSQSANLGLSSHQCKKKHTLECPDFLKTGSCPRRAHCKLQHHRGPKRPGGLSSSSTPAKRARTKEPSRRSGPPVAIQNHWTPSKAFNVSCPRPLPPRPAPPGPTCLWSCCKALRQHQRPPPPPPPPQGRWSSHHSSRCPAPRRRQTLQMHQGATLQKSKVHKGSSPQSPEASSCLWGHELALNKMKNASVYLLGSA